MAGEKKLTLCLQYQETALQYIQNPEAYTQAFDVTINGKLRHLITYRNDINGHNLRMLHQYFTDYLHYKYRQSKYSYAYAKGKSIVDCVNQHLTGSVFLKTDIHGYFDSITYDRMLQRILQLNISEDLHDRISLITKACFYNGSLPIGYVSSPILSDLFLVDLDRKYSKIKKINYTRYADDFIISCSDPASSDYLSALRLRLESDLNDLDLELNRKKTYMRRLSIPGDSIHVLGVNIVKTETAQNRITVSDRYIRKTSKLLCSLLNGDILLPDREKLLVKVFGQINFIGQCSSDSFIKLQTMVYVKSGYHQGLNLRALRKAIDIAER